MRDEEGYSILKGYLFGYEHTLPLQEMIVKNLPHFTSSRKPAPRKLLLGLYRSFELELKRLG